MARCCHAKTDSGIHADSTIEMGRCRKEVFLGLNDSMASGLASLALSVLLLAACHKEEIPADDESAEDTASTVEVSLLNVSMELEPEIPTVVHANCEIVTNNIGKESIGVRLSYWTGSEFRESLDTTITEQEDGTLQCAALILGLAAGTTYQYELEAYSDGVLLDSYQGSITTEPAPSSLFSLAVEYSKTGSFRKGFLLSSWTVSPPSVFILDREGRYVWWRIEEDEPEEMVLVSARFALDNESILYALYPGLFSDDIDEISTKASKIVRVSMDGRQVEEYEAPDLHHSFTELPDGTLAWLAYDFHEVNGRTVTFDRIVERSPEGETRYVWSTWDLSESLEDSGGETSIYWTHSNFMEYNPDEDAYYVSLHNVNSIVKVERSTRELEWILGGVESYFSMPVEDNFKDQHGFELLNGESSILIFDDHTHTDMDDGGTTSRAIELALDTTDWTANSTWEYTPDPVVLVFCFGDVTRLSYGNTLVNFGCSGQLDEVTADGELVWRLRSLVGGAFGYHDFRGSLY